MLKFQWNALRRGDAVLVHDTTDPDFALMRGEVVIVDTVVGSTNDLAVRIGAESPVVRPARLTVHVDPLDPNEFCWRCDIAKPPGDTQLLPAGARAA
jgi:hypothetical protein